MVGTTFRVILVSLFVVAVVNGRRSNAQWDRQGHPKNGSDSKNATKYLDHIENLKLNDVAVKDLFKVIDEVINGNENALVQLQMLNILDDLTTDNLCSDSDNDTDTIYNKFYYGKRVLTAISEARFQTLETAEKIRKRIKDVQKSIQNIRYVIESVSYSCPVNTVAKDCNNLINKYIVNSDDRELLQYEAVNLQMISDTAYTYLKFFKDDFDKAVASNNVVNFFLNSTNLILVLVEELTKIRKNVSPNEGCENEI